MFSQILAPHLDRTWKEPGAETETQEAEENQKRTRREPRQRFIDGFATTVSRGEGTGGQLAQGLVLVQGPVDGAPCVLDPGPTETVC